MARSIGLEKGFFSYKKAHKYRYLFKGYHVNQLKKIGQSLVSEFGNAYQKELIVVDIDQSARPTYAQLLSGATFVQTQKHGQKCLQWSVAWGKGEVIDHELSVRLSSLHR